MTTASQVASPPRSKLIGLGLVVAVGLQTLALYAGIAAATHLPWILAAPVALAMGTAVLLLRPLVATLIAFASSILVWHWPWLLAVALFLPLGVTNFMVGGTIGIAWLVETCGGRPRWRDHVSPEPVPRARRCRPKS